MAGVRVAVAGAAGRMGRMIVKATRETPGVELSAALVSGRTGAPGLAGEGPVTADLDAALHGADVMIDFTTPAATADIATRAARRGVALVVGTTGLDPATLDAVAAAARRVPVVRSANMSLGVNVLLGLLARASRALGDFDVEIVELHHRHKRDAPSGTALLMEQTVAGARQLDPAASLRSGRSGLTGTRGDDEIGVLAVRGGDVVGEHIAYLLGSGERLEIAHRATDRGIFAVGAVRAALWVAGRPPGLYDMQDVLGLRT